MTREGVSACAAQAVAIAKASAMAKRKEVVMADGRAYIDSWQSPFRKDPFEIPLETQLALAAGGGRGDAAREGRDADGNGSAISQDRFVVCVEHWFADSSAESDFRVRYCGDFVSGRRDSEAVVSK